MKRLFINFLILLAFLVSMQVFAQHPDKSAPSIISAVPSDPLPPQSKARTIVLTDGEGDDCNSMIRYLLYCNEFETLGLIYQSSKYHYVGHSWRGTTWIPDKINHYESAYQNLQKHASGWPTPQSLRSVVKVGQISKVGMNGVGNGQDTDGSNLIFEVLAQQDTLPVFIQGWGGINTLGQALWKIQNSTLAATEKERRYRKCVVYCVSEQDGSSGLGTASVRQWIAKTFPTIRIILSNHQYEPMRGKQETTSSGKINHVSMSDAWVSTHLKGHNALPAGQSWSYLSEGDSPALLFNLQNGLRGMENPFWGSWGGRFVKTSYENSENYWDEATDNGGDNRTAVVRWLGPNTGTTANAGWYMQNDLQARADWATNGTFSSANHPPKVIVDGSLDVYAGPGDNVNLSVAGSTDPDGNTLSYKWWQYEEADNLGDVNLSGAASSACSFTMPSGAAGSYVNIICEVTDNGIPVLCSFAQFIIRIGTPVSID
jgi:hypothetical protein